MTTTFAAHDARRRSRSAALVAFVLASAMGGSARAEIAETSRYVTAGAGFGGMVLDDGTLARDQQVRIAVGVGATTVELRVGWAPEALGSTEAGAARRDLLHASMGFGFRIYRATDLNPFVSLSLETWAVTEQGRTALGFGLAGLVGVEFEVAPGHQSPGDLQALIFGVELELHRRLVAQPGLGQSPEGALSFGGYAKWRF